MKIECIHIRIIFLILLLAGSYLSYAQDKLVVKGSMLKVGEEETIYINGNLVVKDNNQNDQNIHNEGQIIITDSIINEVNNMFISSSNPAPDIDPAGIVIIKGVKDQWLTGQDTIYFNDLIINNDSVLYLDININAFGDIQFQNGNIFLNGHDIDLYHLGMNRFSGQLVNESDENRIIDNVHDFDLSNYVRAYSPTIQTAQNVGNLGAEITRSTGDIIVERGHTSLTGVTSTSIPRFYNFYSINNNEPDETGILVIYYFDSDFDEVSYDEDDVLVFSSGIENNVFTSHETTRDTDNNRASASQLNLLRRYTLSSEECDVPLSLNLVSDTVVCFLDTLEIVPEIDLVVEEIFYEWYDLGTNLLLDTTQSLLVSGNISGETMYYELRAMDSRGCYGRDTVAVEVKPLPEAMFHVEGSDCQKDSLQLIDDTPNIGSELFYAWDFDDGTFEFIRNPGKHYDQHGEYVISQTVYSEFGCSDVYEDTVRIFANPVAGFSEEKICNTNIISFSNESTVEDSYLNRAVWVMGDDLVSVIGNENVEAGIDYEFENPGTYDIQYIVFSYHGNCSDTASREITLIPSDTARFDFENLCYGDTTVFLNTSFTEGINADFEWDFGDGNSSDREQTDHVYQEAGMYTVTLYINNNDCQTSYTASVEINELPVPDFSFVNSCAGNNVQFINTTPGTNNYNWIIDNTTYSSVSAEHFFTDYGEYDINLEAEDQLTGCAADTTKTVFIHAVPVAGFQFINVCFGEVNNFENMSAVTSGEGISSHWYFGDGNESAEINPAHEFTDNYGIYEVRLEVVSDSGCIDDTTQYVEVYRNPVIGFEEEIQTCGNTLLIYPQEEAEYYLWQDGSTGYEYLVEEEGEYSLKITDINGCTDSDTTFVILFGELNIPLPQSRINCGPDSLDAGYFPGARYEWNGITGEQKIVVETSGSYQVVVTDQNECVDSAVCEVVINRIPTVELTGETIGCTGIPEVFTVLTDADSIFWSNGQRDISTVNITGTGLVFVDVQTTEKCWAHDEMYITFNEPPQLYLEDEVKGCNQVTLDPLHAGPVFLWSNNENTSTITVDTEGLYWVQVTDENGCTMRDSVLVELDYLTIVDLGEDLHLCTYDNDSLDAGNYPSDFEYFWNGLPGTRYFKIANAGEYTVEVAAPNGCHVYDTIVVEIHESPVVNLESEIPYCEDLILIDAESNGTEYEWLSADGSVSYSQMLEASDTGIYKVRVRNEYCETIDSTYIFETEHRVMANFLVSDTVLIDSSVLFSNVSYPDYAVFTWDFGDGSYNVDDYQPTHVYYWADEFQISLIAATQHCADTMVKTKTVMEIPPGDKTDWDYMPKDIPGYVSFVSSKLYPNPTTGFFTLEFELSNPADALMYMYDLSGRLVMFEKLHVEEVYSHDFDAGNLQRGLYLITVHTKYNSITHKVIVIK